jgi:hypothetical protein
MFGTLTHRGRQGYSAGADQIGVGTSEKDVRRWFDAAHEVSPDFRVAAGLEWHQWRSSPHWHLVAGGLRPGIADALPFGPPACKPCDGQDPSSTAASPRDVSPVRTAAAQTGPADGRGFVAAAAWNLWQSWFDEHGIARLERPRSAGDVALYTTKYVLKQRVGPLLILGV